MTGINLHVGRKSHDLISQTAYQLLVIATGEVRTSDAHAEERIAREEHLLFGTIEADAARSVSRSVNHLQGVASEGNLISFVQQAAQGRHGVTVGGAQKHLALSVHIVIERGIRRMAFRQHLITVGNEAATEDVVKVRVRVNLMYGAQLFLFDVGSDGLLVGGIISAAVDDDRFARFVAYNVAVLRHHIGDDAFYFQHVVLQVLE